MKKFAAALGLAVAVLAAAPAWAIPVTFTSGSFSIAAFTTTKSDVTTTTAFAISPPDVYAGSPTGDFSFVSLPSPLSTPATLDFSTVSTFNFSDAALGTFTAATATLTDSASGGNAFATWVVDGTFLLGSDWTNAGSSMHASETWSLTQTGGSKKAISISGTFAANIRSETSVPEPATLALFGAGMIGIGWRRGRKKTT